MTERRHWSESKTFDTRIVFLQLNLKNNVDSQYFLLGVKANKKHDEQRQ